MEDSLHADCGNRENKKGMPRATTLEMSPQQWLVRSGEKAQTLWGDGRRVQRGHRASRMGLLPLSERTSNAWDRVPCGCGNCIAQWSSVEGQLDHSDLQERACGKGALSSLPPQETIHMDWGCFQIVQRQATQDQVIHSDGWWLRTALYLRLENTGSLG